MILLAAAQATEPANQLDFWIGEWECVGRSRTTPGKDEWTETTAKNSIKKILGGRVVEESFSMTGFEGRSVSVYDARHKVWRQTWVDSAGGYLVLAGTFADGKLTLDLAMGPGATEGLGMRMVFSEIKKDTIAWDWQRTTDGGKTWETQWRLDYKRKQA